MAKSFAQIRPDIWLDDDFRALTAGAQHLYFVMLTDPGLSYAGIADWKPLRIAQRAAEWPVQSLMRAAVELSYAHFLVFDQDTEEVMVRSFMRHDGLLKQPRMAVSVAKAFGTIGSNKLRAVVVHELLRLKREGPELEGWEKPQMKTVLRQNSVDPKTLETDLDMPQGVDFGVDLPQIPRSA
jgi:hypothetical protein